MADTIATMEWRLVDTLAAYQLEIGDYIRGAEGEIVELIQINDDESSIVVIYGDDYGDIYYEQFGHDDPVEIYMIFDMD